MKKLHNFLFFIFVLFFSQQTVFTQKLEVFFFKNILKVEDASQKVLLQQTFKKEIQDAQLSPDNNFVAIEFADQSVKLKNISRTFKTIEDIDFAVKRKVWSYSFSPGGDFFAIHCDGSLNVADLRNIDWSKAVNDCHLISYNKYNPESKTYCRKTFSLYNGQIASAIEDFCFSFDDRFLCVKFEDNWIELYDLAKNPVKILCRKRVDQIRFSPNGRYLFVKYNGTSTIEVFDLFSLIQWEGEPRVNVLYSYKDELKGGCFSKNSRYVAFVSKSGLLEVVDLDKEGKIILIEPHVASAQFNKENNAIKVTYVGRLRKRSKKEAKTFSLVKESPIVHAISFDSILKKRKRPDEQDEPEGRESCFAPKRKRGKKIRKIRRA